MALLPPQHPVTQGTLRQPLLNTKAKGTVLTLTCISSSEVAVAEALLTAGIRGVLNFTPQVLRLPSSVSVVSVDLTVQLEQLAFLVQLNGEE